MDSIVLSPDTTDDCGNMVAFDVHCLPGSSAYMSEIDDDKLGALQAVHASEQRFASTDLVDGTMPVVCCGGARPKLAVPLLNVCHAVQSVTVPDRRVPAHFTAMFSDDVAARRLWGRRSVDNVSSSGNDDASPEEKMRKWREAGRALRELLTVKQSRSPTASATSDAHSHSSADCTSRFSSRFGGASASSSVARCLDLGNTDISGSSTLSRNLLSDVFHEAETKVNDLFCDTQNIMKDAFDRCTCRLSQDIVATRSSSNPTSHCVDAPNISSTSILPNISVACDITACDDANLSSMAVRCNSCLDECSEPCNAITSMDDFANSNRSGSADAVSDLSRMKHRIQKLVARSTRTKPNSSDIISKRKYATGRAERRRSFDVAHSSGDSDSDLLVARTPICRSRYPLGTRYGSGRLRRSTRSCSFGAASNSEPSKTFYPRLVVAESHKLHAKDEEHKSEHLKGEAVMHHILDNLGHKENEPSSLCSCQAPTCVICATRQKSDMDIATPATARLLQGHHSKFTRCTNGMSGVEESVRDLPERPGLSLRQFYNTSRHYPDSASDLADVESCSSPTCSGVESDVDADVAAGLRHLTEDQRQQLHASQHAWLSYVADNAVGSTPRGDVACGKLGSTAGELPKCEMFTSFLSGPTNSVNSTSNELPQLDESDYDLSDIALSGMSSVTEDDIDMNLQASLHDLHFESLSMTSTDDADDEFECDCAVCTMHRNNITDGWMTAEDLYPPATEAVSADDRVPFTFAFEDPQPDYYTWATNSNNGVLLETMFQDVIAQMLTVYPDLLGHHAPPPVTDAVFSGLTTYMIDTTHLVDDNSCPICLCVFVEHEEVKLLPCKHTFHTLCIQAWLSKSGTCPVCRDVVAHGNIIPDC